MQSFQNVYFFPVPPFLSSGNSNQTSRIAQSATISCEAYGDTPLAIVWSRDNISLAEAPGYSKYQVEMLRTINSTISSIKVSIYFQTSRERPKSALYLRLKIVKGGPFGLFETPVGCTIWKKIEGGPFGDFKNFSKKNLKRFLNSASVPKNVKRGPFGFFGIHFVANYRNKSNEGGPFGAIQKISKKVA